MSHRLGGNNANGNCWCIQGVAFKVMNDQQTQGNETNVWVCLLMLTCTGLTVGVGSALTDWLRGVAASVWRDFSGYPVVWLIIEAHCTIPSRQQFICHECANWANTNYNVCFGVLTQQALANQGSSPAQDLPNDPLLAMHSGVVPLQPLSVVLPVWSLMHSVSTAHTSSGL